jgi:hypothetical protein
LPQLLLDVASVLRADVALMLGAVATRRWNFVLPGADFARLRT